MDRLTVLDISFCVNIKKLNFMANRLEELYACGTNIFFMEEEFLPFGTKGCLSGYSCLKILDLSYTNVMFKHLEKFVDNEIHTLYLNGTNFSTQTLSSMKNLTNLSINETQVTNEYLDQLVMNHRLKKLSVWCCKSLDHNRLDHIKNKIENVIV
eukprot:TRINITY_DN1571_c0_g2_i1.p1 TRINITY_DN1571_c0_g2~~TRINITY_DN1571_c0_g2_i1.p1  ORF type:complete len:154 (+),score=22.98 TRINITY_DN1571_c0_g2_i1:571-1032(+)